MSFDSRKLQGPPYRNTEHAQKPTKRLVQALLARCYLAMHSTVFGNAPGKMFKENPVNVAGRRSGPAVVALAVLGHGGFTP